MNRRAFLHLATLSGALASARLAGREQAALTAYMRERQGKLDWRLVDWTHRGDRVCILWETTNWVGDRELKWRGWIG